LIPPELIKAVDLRFAENSRIDVRYGPTRAELAGLVLAGKKRATCWAASDGPQTETGKPLRQLDRFGSCPGGARSVAYR
jgi:uncharacterized protein YhfF